MAGGAGNDTYVVDTAGDVVTEAAGQGTDTVQSSISYTLGANVENLTLTGTGNIDGTGNALNNALTGNAGNNILDGGAGTDTMVGGAGNDTYVVDATSDVVTEAASEGTDTVQSSVTYTLGTNVENLTLTGTRQHQRHRQHARQHADRQRRQQRPERRHRQRHAWLGGAGDDTYVVDAAGDVVTEHAGEGTDLVQSGVTYTLGANVENLTLTGTGNINGTGNTLDNTLTGNTGANILDGGAGDDTMVGGTGNDTYVVDNVGRRGDGVVQRGRHRHGAERHQLHAGRQRREPDPDRDRQHQRHRQYRQQHAHRQRRQQRARRRRRHRHHARRRRATTPTWSMRRPTW